VDGLLISYLNTTSITLTSTRNITDSVEAPDHLFTFLYEGISCYYTAPNFYADCREHGGTTTKPAYWP
jgi:hypothetical protein